MDKIDLMTEEAILSTRRQKAEIDRMMEKYPVNPEMGQRIVEGNRQLAELNARQDELVKRFVGNPIPKHIDDLAKRYL